MKNWSEEIIKTIDEKLEGTREKDLRFYRIAELKRNIERVDEFSKSCPHCQKMQIDIREMADKIDEAIDVPGKSRRHYDRLISRLSKHMQKEHGFFAPYYFSYLYAFYGAVVGAIAGILLVLSLPFDPLEVFTASFALAMIAAYVLGNIRDKRIRREKRLM